MTSPDAAWMTVARDLVRRIRAGEFPVGAKIPSRNQLMARHNVSDGTIRRALGHLANVGVITGSQGLGVFVVRMPTEADLAPEPTVQERITDLERRLAEAEGRIAELQTLRVEFDTLKERIAPADRGSSARRPRAAG